MNYGVDIKASGDLSVKCVAGGVVSVIDYIPGYGSVIIVTHKGDFRTVYSHLSEIYVNEGDKVKAGSLLAKVGESLEGNILHFEIWNSRKNQNPEQWLAKK
jgi:murein DD-endopeptidase MepM/ murein hydrolase activator NlpD